jgi:hypothetical protein
MKYFFCPTPAPPSAAFTEDVSVLKRGLRSLKFDWDGKESVLELQKADYNWRQLEWFGWYFELICRNALKGQFKFPGERIGSTSFDLSNKVNWDMKAKALDKKDHHCILNDCHAMETSIEKFGEHGLVLAICEVEYDNKDREFQKWHTELKGGKSAYEEEREARTDNSRYRKTRAVLTEIRLLRFTKENLAELTKMHQGRNSNGKPRPEKYLLDLREIEKFTIETLKFPKPKTPLRPGKPRK